MGRPNTPVPGFRYSAEIMYFIRQDLNGKRLGTKILDSLESEGKTGDFYHTYQHLEPKWGQHLLPCNQWLFSMREVCKGGREKGMVFDTIRMQKFI
jgi:hypothetical protein